MSEPETTNDPLLAALEELAVAQRDESIPLILGGGLGLFLKQRLRQQQARAGDVRTLLPADAWPPARSTEDMDLILPTEIVADLGQMQSLRRVLDRLGYTPSVPHMQFVKTTPAGPVKVDLLTGPPHPPELEANLRQSKPPRVQPSAGRAKLHAYATPEALRPAVGATPVPIGVGVEALVAGSSALLLMKLHATRDRLARGDRDLAGKHALDLYRLLAMLTREEEEGVVQLLRQHREHPPVGEAEQIVAGLFATNTSPGIIAAARQAAAGSGGGTTLSMRPFLETLHRLLSARAE
jgi:hypothetical protein